MRTFVSRCFTPFCCALLLTFAGWLHLPGVQTAAAQEISPGSVVYLPQLSNQFPFSAITYTSPVQYGVTKGVTVANTSYNLNRLRVYLPAPPSFESQSVQAGSITPGGYSLSYDATYGNGILYWNITGAPSKGQSLTLQETFTVTVYQVESLIIPSQVQPYDTHAPLYSLYTRSEKNLEAADALIIQAKNAAVGSETNPYLQARLIYQYVIDHIHYELNDHLQGAKLTLELGHGECGDYAAVFVAMARAAGIPARPVVGYRAYSGEAHHVWAEFYLQGLGWIPVDPTDGDSGADAFGRLDNARIALSKGYNVQISSSPYNLYAILFQSYWWYIEGSGTGISASEVWVVKP